MFGGNMFLVNTLIKEGVTEDADEVEEDHGDSHNVRDEWLWPT